MRTSVLVGLAAGTALSMSALAQEQSLVPIQRDRGSRQLKVCPPEAFHSNQVGYRSTATRSVGPELVYDNCGWDGTSYFGHLDYWFWFGFLNAPHYADDVSLRPGNSSALNAPGQFLTGWDVMVDCQDGFSSGARNFDMVVNFWDTANPVAAPAAPFTSNLVSFVVNLTLDNLYTYLIPLDLTALPAGGLLMPDMFCVVEVAFYETGTSTYMPVGDAAAMNFNCTSTWNTDGESANLTNGSGTPQFWFDNGALGYLDNGRRYVVGGAAGYTRKANFAMNLYGDARCAADFDNNGFVEPIDYNNFINAYEAGPCP